jgi:hypothetical protein
MFLSMEKGGEVLIRNQPIIDVRIHNSNIYVDKYDEGGNKVTMPLSPDYAFIHISEKQV